MKKMIKNKNRLTIRIKENIDEKISELSKNNNVTKNEIINIILLNFFENKNEDLLDFNFFTLKNEHEYRIYLFDKEKEFLDKKRAEHGFSFITSEIKFRLLNTIYNDKFFTNIEMKSLNDAVNDINVLGRNINTILKNAIETNKYNFDINYEKFSSDLKTIKEILYKLNREMENVNYRVQKRK
ncbi:hypothetical protein CBLAS_1046 [Campylobacter blaseri]|uniref:Bacterial mobilisation domain-containing protein n=1 Tax=Campylobacter blaseri TaxID=2042961 RepID=A0A2P8QYH7_9BACT|nr:hypothetical protein [Campylobacter blaseri]PSM51304.1 hypothetical protein CQ405_08725 [Campylobacter blaseri]PSM52448.1 hypothetical protein CRN67_08730 [Campylobacter blaseri]QKF86223.1 hypothetical protein CBLAS_1046 [Campylobacter blaseri]